MSFESSRAASVSAPGNFIAPRDWTNDPKELQNDYYFKGPNAYGMEILTDIGISQATGVMCSTRASGGGLYMFESGGIYYIWNMVEGHVFQIDEAPGNITLILDTIRKNKGGVGMLKMKEAGKNA